MEGKFGGSKNGENYCIICSPIFSDSAKGEGNFLEGRVGGKLRAIMEKIRQRQQEEKSSPLGKLIKSPSEQNLLF